MIARRFTLICFMTAIAGTLFATLAADLGRTPRDWQPCDLLGADGCRSDR